MIKYLKNSSAKISIDLNPFMWSLRFEVDWNKPKFLYVRIFFLTFMLIVDNGIVESMTQAISDEAEEEVIREEDESEAVLLPRTAKRHR